MSNKTVKYSTEAYVQVGLHLAKYPDCTICGYLVGSSQGHEITVTEVFPIAHGAPAGPILETFGQVIEKGLSNGTHVIGFYYATELNGTAVFADRLQNELKRIVTDGPVVMCKVNNDLLSDNAALFLESTVSNAKAKTSTFGTPQEANATLDKALQRSLAHALVDFEDHMNSCGKHDFRNIELIRTLRSL